MIAGEDVIVYTPNLTGKDNFNEDTITWNERRVSNVLIGETTTSDVISNNRPHETNMYIDLYFPKTFNGDLRGCEVIVRGKRLKIVGEIIKYTDKNVPLNWNIHCKAGAIHG